MASGFDEPQMVLELEAEFDAMPLPPSAPKTTLDAATGIAAAIVDNYTPAAGITEHHDLDGLGDNDHPRYQDRLTSEVVARRNVVQAIANDTQTNVIFSTEDKDADGEYDHTTGIFTAGATGSYAYSYALLLESAAWDVGERFQTGASKNGSVTSGNVWYGYRWYAQAAHTGFASSIGSGKIPLSATETLVIKAYHDQGAAVNLFANGTFNYLHIKRVG